VALRSAGLPAPRPAAILVAAAELVVVVVALSPFHILGGLVVAVAYLSFSAFLVRLVAAGGGAAGCGCFGGNEDGAAPVGYVHIILTVVATVIAIDFSLTASTGVLTQVRATPLAGVPCVTLTLISVYLLYLAFHQLPLPLKHVNRRRNLATTMS
jgi:hypothetical protein